MEWQPIETAPKDGDTRVLLGRIGYAEQMAVAWWSNRLDGWVTVIGGHTFSEASHWMPLPQPPKE